MEIAKNILIVIYLIVCVALILTTVMQNKDSRNSMEDVAENPRANKYFEKNKSRTKSGKIQKNTIAGQLEENFTASILLVAFYQYVRVTHTLDKYIVDQRFYLILIIFCN